MCSRDIEAIDADRLSRNGGTKVHSYLELSSDSQVWFPALLLLWDLIEHWLKTSALAQRLCWRHIQKGRSRMETNFAEDIGPQLMEKLGRVDCAVVLWSHLMSSDVSPQAVSLDRAAGSVLSTPASVFLNSPDSVRENTDFCCDSGLETSLTRPQTWCHFNSTSPWCRFLLSSKDPASFL